MHSSFIVDFPSLQTAWVRRWYALYPDDVTLGVRLFAYETKDSAPNAERNGTWKLGRPIYILSRISCVKRTKVKDTKLRDHEVLEITAANGRTVSLTCESDYERNAWHSAFLRALQMESSSQLGAAMPEAEMTSRSQTPSVASLVNNDVIFSENAVYESGEVGTYKAHESYL